MTNKTICAERIVHSIIELAMKYQHALNIKVTYEENTLCVQASRFGEGHGKHLMFECVKLSEIKKIAKIKQFLISHLQDVGCEREPPQPKARTPFKIMQDITALAFENEARFNASIDYSAGMNLMRIKIYRNSTLSNWVAGDLLFRDCFLFDEFITEDIERIEGEFMNLIFDDLAAIS